LPRGAPFRKKRAARKSVETHQKVKREEKALPPLHAKIRKERVPGTGSVVFVIFARRRL